MRDRLTGPSGFSDCSLRKAVARCRELVIDHDALQQNSWLEPSGIERRWHGISTGTILWLHSLNYEWNVSTGAGATEVTLRKNASFLSWRCRFISGCNLLILSCQLNRPSMCKKAFITGITGQDGSTAFTPIRTTARRSKSSAGSRRRNSPTSHVWWSMRISSPFRKKCLARLLTHSLKAKQRAHNATSVGSSPTESTNLQWKLKIIR